MLDLAMHRELFSQPSFFWMPENSPIHFAVCSVALPDGCEIVDSQVSHRLATGAGQSREAAAFKARMEAVERYSIQFRKGYPEYMSSFSSTDAEIQRINTEKLLIGKPMNSHDVTTVGCAAGVDLASASLRACGELLEHSLFEEYNDGALELVALKAIDFRCMIELSEWLENQFRRLDIRLAKLDCGVKFALVTCSDHDFGRLTMGRSCALKTEEAVFSAASEAVLSWRNMVELERNGKGRNELMKSEEVAVSMYRGAKGNERLPDAPEYSLSKFEKREAPMSVSDILNTTCEQLGAAVSLFDLTDPRIGIPVVRAVNHDG